MVVLCVQLDLHWHYPLARLVAPWDARAALARRSCHEEAKNVTGTTMAPPEAMKTVRQGHNDLDRRGNLAGTNPKRTSRP